MQYAGIVTFANLPNVACLMNTTEVFDIAIIGAPFDTAVSYRTGNHADWLFSSCFVTFPSIIVNFKSLD